MCNVSLRVCLKLHVIVHLSKSIFTLILGSDGRCGFRSSIQRLVVGSSLVSTFKCASMEHAFVNGLFY